MPGSSIGKLFCLSSFGESHGRAVGVVVDGCPPGLELSAADIQPDLDRRRPGQSRYVTQRSETDQVEVLSGVFEGKTTGTPIALLIGNSDAKPKDYDDIRDVFRPGHADYTYQAKYGIRDHRGGGRSSARETAARVAAAAIARKYLAQRLGIAVRACLCTMGPLQAQTYDWSAVENNPFNWPCPEQVPELEKLINTVRKAGDSIGAEVLLEATGVPPGLGDPVFDRLDADIAKAMMSINAVKAVSIGDGFAVVGQRGSEHRDEMLPEGFASNHAGGVLGGLSSGQPIIVRMAVKPASSILIKGRTVDTSGQPRTVVTKGRHDPCVGIRAVVIAEAMMLITLMDHFLRQQSLESSSLVNQPAPTGEPSGV
ncbi:MAG: chorismate synthase [Gammaproteobacteria bacterium]|nr:chorismate synthase [Pseudomonadota bacterium]MCH9663800.1 chorismate synthase [Gammaproteobacteria bacterium]